MLKVENWMDIKELYRNGCKIKQIARMTGYSRNTVRKFLKGLRKERVNAEKLTVRFETPPGKQTQADWGYCGMFPDGAGGSVKVYFFTMVLSYSRMLFVKFCTSMEIGSLVERHREAFAYFGGWTSEILYDNMSQVRKGPGRLNPLFADFAMHYGFSVKTHRPYRARTKGKVERAVDYVKESFLNGREFNGLDDLNARALHWMENTANVRIHGTTGRRPCDLFPMENLVPVSSAAPYVHASRAVRKVGADARVLFGRSSYTVPPAEVSIRSPGIINILYTN
jgi:transposase